MEPQLRALIERPSDGSRSRRIGLIVALTLALAACGSDAGDSASPPALAGVSVAPSIATVATTATGESTTTAPPTTD
ncbi:MAG TPA: hypothetical protein VGM78_14375, partial [Ilumatobacteraceae bacterium]